MSSFYFAAFLALSMLSRGGCADDAQPPPRRRAQQGEFDVVRVKTFYSSSVVALLAGMDLGFFGLRNLTVDHTYTKTSGELRGDLASGAIDIAYAVSDNSVFMGANASVILSGGDSSMNEFITQDYVENFEAMGGKTLIVDAPNTAYALQAYKALRIHGLDPGTYRVQSVGGTNIRYAAMKDNTSFAATALAPPFSILATRQDGLRSLGRMIDIVGPYQASCLFAARDWVALHGDVGARFIAAWVESLRWVRDPANEDAVVKLMVSTFGTDVETAQIQYDLLLDPVFGLTPDMALQEDGFQNVLNIRDEFEGGGPFDTGDFVDLSYYEQALTFLTAEAGEEGGPSSSSAAPFFLMSGPLRPSWRSILTPVALLALPVFVY